MQSYETCLIGVSGKVSLFALSRYFSDAAAVRAARHMCLHGEMVQIWRGDICIHNDCIPIRAMQNTRRTNPSFRLE